MFPWGFRPLFPDHCCLQSEANEYSAKNPIAGSMSDLYKFADLSCDHLSIAFGIEVVDSSRIRDTTIFGCLKLAAYCEYLRDFFVPISSQSLKFFKCLEYTTSKIASLIKKCIFVTNYHFSLCLAHRTHPVKDQIFISSCILFKDYKRQLVL